MWLARDGTYVRESKSHQRSLELLAEAVDAMLAHNPRIRIAIEPKPNEPIDHAYLPTIGHALAFAHLTSDPARVGGLIETAHCVLAGLDPADEMEFALTFGKLWSVHLNDQNGLKFDQDKPFGSVNLRSAFNQVRVLERHGYGTHGEFVGFDVHSFRTTTIEQGFDHAVNSRRDVPAAARQGPLVRRGRRGRARRAARLPGARPDGDRAPAGLSLCPLTVADEAELRRIHTTTEVVRRWDAPELVAADRVAGDRPLPPSRHD